MSINKLPPHDIAAEESVIGSLLIDGEAIAQITLDATDFYHTPLQLIYKACRSLYEHGAAINQITVAQELSQSGAIESSGGVAYLSHLISQTPTSLDIVDYAKIVTRLAIARRLIHAGERIQTLGHSSPSDVADALNRADEMLIEIRKHGVVSPILSPKERVSKLFDRYAELHSKEMVMATRTGISDLDRLLGGGFYNGDLIIVGGRASMGKTTLVNALAHNIGMEGNVLFCSAEMNNDAISDRDVASLVGVPTSRIRLGNYDQGLFTKIMDALGSIAESNVWVYDDVPMTTNKILQVAIGIQARLGLKLLVIDYLGMLDDEYGRNQYERVGYISRKLKLLARKLDVPIIVCHQLNRELEKREDKRPQLFDLRDAGNIEQDADVVIFVYRDSYYQAMQGVDVEDFTTEIIVAKHRQGDTGIVRTVYDKEHQKYLPIYKPLK